MNQDIASQWTSFPVLRTAAVLLVLFTATACDYPWWSSDHIKVTATFRPDGSCSFAVDGVTLSDDRYRQSDRFESGSGFTTTESDGYSISCEFPGAMIPPLPTLSIIMATPKGRVPGPGNYEVSAEDGLATHIQTTAGVFFYEKYARSGLANGITGAQLMAFEGALVIDTVTPRPLVIGGHLSVVARRKALGI